MKQSLYLLLVSIVLIPLNSYKPPPDKERIEVVFNRQLSFENLASIKSDLLEKGIVIQYQNIEFDKNFRLKALGFSVDCRDGFSGKAHSNNLAVSRFGFYRDYSKQAASPFGTGSF